MEGLADLSVVSELSDVESIKEDLQELKSLCGSQIIPEEESVMNIIEITNTGNRTGVLPKKYRLRKKEIS
jgi:hypothetical protein